MEFCTAVKKNVTLCVHSPGTISKINEVNKRVAEGYMKHTVHLYKKKGIYTYMLHMDGISPESLNKVIKVGVLLAAS